MLLEDEAIRLYYVNHRYSVLTNRYNPNTYQTFEEIKEMQEDGTFFDIT